MQTRSFTIILLRVAAVLVMSRGFTYVGQLISMALRGPATGADLTFVAALTLLLPFVIGMVAWWIAPWVASLATRTLPDTLETGKLTVESLAHAAFVVIGTWLVLDALPPLLGHLIELFAPDSPTRIAWLANNLLRGALGVALVIGSRATSRALLRLRYAGTNQ